MTGSQPVPLSSGGSIAVIGLQCSLKLAFVRFDVDEVRSELVLKMKRHTWLMATLAVLVGLQLPLCALACVVGAQPAAVEVSDAPELPCHGELPVTESEPASTPEGDCGCDQITAALASTLDVSAELPSPVLLQPVTAAQSPRAGSHWTPLLSASVDLPPPDLLLLHSILVI